MHDSRRESFRITRRYNHISWILHNDTIKMFKSHAGVGEVDDKRLLNKTLFVVTPTRSKNKQIDTHIKQTTGIHNLYNIPVYM